MGVINEELDLSIDSIDNGTADTTVDNGSDTTTITNPPAPEDKGSNEGNNQQSSSTGEDTTTQTDNNTANNKLNLIYCLFIITLKRSKLHLYLIRFPLYDQDHCKGLIWGRVGVISPLLFFD